MINSGREWDWMDSRIHKDIDDSIIEDLKGWGFDIEALNKREGGGVTYPDRRSPRAFSTSVSNDSYPSNQLKEDEWCAYGGLPSPNAYIEQTAKAGV